MVWNMSKINKKDPFSSIFNFTCKDGLVTPATCKYYLLVVNPSDEAFYKFLPLPTIAKITILNVVEFLDLPLKTLPFMKASLVSCETSLFLISKCCQLYQKSLCFSLLVFTAWWTILVQPFRWLLQLSCFYGSSQWLFKAKITCK